MVCRPLRKSAGLLSANLFLRSDASPVGPTRIAPEIGEMLQFIPDKAPATTRSRSTFELFVLALVVTGSVQFILLPRIELMTA